MEAKSDSERRQALAMAVGDLVAEGCRVEWHADLQAVLVYGRRPEPSPASDLDAHDGFVGARVACRDAPRPRATGDGNRG